MVARPCSSVVLPVRRPVLRLGRPLVQPVPHVTVNPLLPAVSLPATAPATEGFHGRFYVASWKS